MQGMANATRCWRQVSMIWIVLASLVSRQCAKRVMMQYQVQKTVGESNVATDMFRTGSNVSSLHILNAKNFTSPTYLLDDEAQSFRLMGTDLLAVGSFSSSALEEDLNFVKETMQWHGDVFGKPKERDLGWTFFKMTDQTEWIILGVAVIVLMLLDQFVIRHFTGNIACLSFWIFLAGIFNLIVWYRQGREAGLMWFSGYFLEWLLSMDNLFVFVLIFRVYATPKQLLHKALFLGIFGAVIFRMMFFVALSSLLHMLHWFRFVFGGLLIYSGIQAARDDDDDMDPSELWIVRGLKHCLGPRLSEKYDIENLSLFVWEDGKAQATLLVPVIVCLEVTDILFAVDSVSAKVAQIPDYYLAYSSSVVAMFGLRAMFFIIEDLVGCFELLKYGLCFILVFIGVELMVEDYVKLPAQVVCVVIFSVFLVCTAGSAARNLVRSYAPVSNPQEDSEDGVSAPKS
mmetsp:Transcript_73710/g.130741  ORF Transcript_73710/g.130741 Transcript_73710/m.130741 type:complete len:457 (-) Transcript_73710:133-1503(-)